jgi:predicted RNA-binding protein with TRAM domain
MVEIPEELACLFSTKLERRDGSYVIEAPEREVDQETIAVGETYRVAVVRAPRQTETRAASGETDATDEAAARAPPVEESEMREVAIETLGDQGDGIAKVERGYVVIVPEGEPGDEVTIEIDEVRQNVAFAHIVDRSSEMDERASGLTAQQQPPEPDSLE